MSIAAISILVGGGLPTFKNGLIMKNINAIILLSSLTSASVFAGAYVENREAYNLASDQGEVMLRVGYKVASSLSIESEQARRHLKKGLVKSQQLPPSR